jgi:transcription elongation factor GreA
VEDERTGARESYNLLLADSADFEDGSVSMGSPIGRALLGKGVGETAILKLPASVRRLKVIELQTIHQQVG